MKNYFKLIHEITLGICIVVLFLAALIAIIAKFSIPGGFRIYSVLTGSMEPAVPTGALIVTKIPGSTQSIHQGDIITFTQPGYQNKFITHRVLNTVTQGPLEFFITKGDANTASDPWRISYGSIKGVYSTEFPYLGYLLEFLKSPLGIVIFVVIPALLITIAEIKNIFGILFQMKLEKVKLKMQTEYNRGQNNYQFIVPLFSLISVLFLGTTQTYALFNSNKVIMKHNTITTDVNSPAPSSSPSASPLPSISPLPSPSKSPCPDDIDTEVSGNWYGSTNKVKSYSKYETEIDQSNSTVVKTVINSEFNTGGENAPETTASASADVETASASATVKTE